MSNRKHHPTEQINEQDSVTYQTGSITPPQHSSALVAILLGLVIFLGGIASAMGIINIRLLTQLSQKPGPATPLSTGVPPLTNPTLGSLLEENSDPAPELPDERNLELSIQNAPYYTENPDRDSVSCEGVYQQTEASLVEVCTITHCNSTMTGSGVVLSEDGYILTNAHVTEAAKRIFIFLSNGQILRAALVGSDPLTDLAVLYVDAEGLIPAEFATSDHLQVTEPVFMVNSQLPASLVQSSILSARHTFSTSRYSLDLIQTCRKFSGGPMLNHAGQVVGIHVGKIARYFASTASSNLGLALPTSTIRSVVCQLVEQGFIPGRPNLGIEVEAISKLYQLYWELPGGLLLTDVNSDAQAQGLEKGDILLALDGKKMVSRDDLYATLYSGDIGDTVTAVIFRNGDMYTVPLTILETTE